MQPPLIMDKYFIGYTLQDLSRHMKRTDYRRLMRVQRKKPMDMYRGQRVIYKYDYDRCIAHEWPYD